MKIAIDVMGGDHAPNEILKGVADSLSMFSDTEFLLFGDEEKIKKFLKEAHLEEEPRIEYIHCEQKIESDDDPAYAVREKKKSSLVKASRAVKKRDADVLLSAGNTGAIVATSIFNMKRTVGVERPALAPVIPSQAPKGTLLLDVGANTETKIEHMITNAHLGSIYMECVQGIKKPRVGLLNIGTEENKGTPFYQDAYQALKNESSLQFIGNVEARDILLNAADVIVTDGFSGNIALKTLEGTAKRMSSVLSDVLRNGSFSGKIGGLLAKKDLMKMRKEFDFSEYGGAALLGISNPVIKAHGSSTAKDITSAIAQAQRFVDSAYVTHATERLSTTEA